MYINAKSLRNLVDLGETALLSGLGGTKQQQYSDLLKLSRTKLRNEAARMEHAEQMRKRRAHDRKAGFAASRNR
jgi:hypothetical protein